MGDSRKRRTGPRQKKGVRSGTTLTLGGGRLKILEPPSGGGWTEYKSLFLAGSGIKDKRRCKKREKKIKEKKRTKNSTTKRGWVGGAGYLLNAIPRLIRQCIVPILRR